MIRLKTILQYRYTTLFILLIILFISFIRVSIPRYSKIDETSNILNGTLLSYKLDDEKISFIIKDKEKVQCTYYYEEEEKKQLENLKLGIKIKVEGKLKTPSNNTIPNTFNYKEYLYNNNIFYTMSVDKITLINNNTFIFYTIKNKLINYIKTFKSKSYLFTFITGDKFYLNEGAYEQYQNLGISHIFAISGMHVSILASIIFKLLSKLRENHRYYIVIIFLLFYSFITNYTASILRSISLYICLFLNKRLSLNLTTIQTFYLAISVILLINPLLIYNIGFIYSTVTSYSLIRYNYLITGNYIIKCLKISLIAFLFSLPITINNNYEINILSTLNNLIFVPLITFIIYPLSLLTLIIPYLDNMMYELMNLIETTSKYLFVYNIIIPKIPNFYIFIYYILLHIFFISYNKLYLLLAILIIIFNKYSYILDNNYYIYYLDVSQGDSTLIKYKDSATLIDTGGNINYSISDNIIIFMKSIGLEKIDEIILTHGDYDHLGETKNIINNFKVNKVIFNNDNLNELELDIINLLEDKKIPYYQNLTKIKNIYFLNNKNYDNENDNSNILYLSIYNYDLLFMGDASIKVENDLLKSYDLNNIDILKVGHHGSNTSTSKNFVNKLNPSYTIISAGKNNRYGHPHKEVLNNLSTSYTYRTDKNGTIEFIINKNKIKLITYKP